MFVCVGGGGYLQEMIALSMHLVAYEFNVNIPFFV